MKKKPAATGKEVRGPRISNSGSDDPIDGTFEVGKKCANHMVKLFRHDSDREIRSIRRDN